ncbi:MAG: WecB/TagA/CpsF family glycosyltransferase [Patescibacteria group bacterium]
MPSKLLGVDLPQITKTELLEKLLKVRKNSKKTLFFLYSEFLLRANRNPFYRSVLNRADFSAVDGQGLHWAQFRISKESPNVNAYWKFAAGLPFLVRVIFFLVVFLVECISTFTSGAYNLIGKTDMSKSTQNEVILGRDFVYNLFTIAQKKKWSVLIIGGGSSNAKAVRGQVLEKYPKLSLDLWTKDSKSDLMRDQLSPAFLREIKNDGVVLNSDNLFAAFPDLKKAKEYIKKTKPDIILVCLGGSSGKQEFFIDNLQRDNEISFTLATGVGAALDHLNIGAKQKKPPSLFNDLGIEWIFRFIMQPYRRRRIWDSVFTLWWWTTLQQFYFKGVYRKTIVNIIEKGSHKQEFLLLRRKNWLPSDVGWCFPQGGVDKDEALELAGLRETKEETNLDNWDLRILRPAYFANYEDYAVSVVRFLALGCLYKGSQNYLNLMSYTGSSRPKTNWENYEARWVHLDKVKQTLSQEKLEIWELTKL